jgi:F-type H+-transporting ATPase subunit delta
VISSAILGRYARSLAEVVFEKNIEETVTEDLKLYCEIFQAFPDLLEMFHSPAVPRDAKERMIGQLFALHPVNLITANFLRVLLQHNRIRYSKQVFEIYLGSVNERKGIVSAKVSTAVPLSSQELESLGKKLTGLTGKLVEVEAQMDASLLGGAVLQVGSTVFDGSIKSKLAEMRRWLAET